MYEHAGERDIFGVKYSYSTNKHCGSAVKRRAHIPEISGSSPSSARHFRFLVYLRDGWVALLGMSHIWTSEHTF
jgi:hypothetical protein